MKEVLDERGQVTIFLSLMFLVMMFVFLCILDGIRVYLNEGLAHDGLSAAGKVVTANYSFPLYERYHLFFLDSREKEFIVSDGMDYMKKYCEQNKGISCQQINVIEQKGILEEDAGLLKEQIKEYVVYQKLEEERQKLSQLFAYQDETNQKAEKQLEEIEKFDEGLMLPEEKQEETTESESMEEEPTEDSTVLEELQKKREEHIRWKEIKDVLKSIFHSGILMYVTDDRAISDLTVSLEGSPSAENREEGINIALPQTFDNIRELMDLLKSEQGNQTFGMEQVLEDSALITYMMKHFRSWMDSSWELDTALHYELEYIIVGDKKDHDNLKSVAERIFLSRFIANYGYIMTDEALVLRADEIALAVSGLLGIPEVKEAVKQILLAALSSGEALLDVHSLFAGKNVPLIKSKGTWTLSFENAVTVLKEKQLVAEGNKNISYQDYLKLFLFVKTGQRQSVFRMADIMQWNVRLEQEDFSIQECLGAYSWEAVFSYTYQYPNPLGNGKQFRVIQDVTY